MKKVLALALVIVMMMAMATVAMAAPTYVGEVVVKLPGFGSLEITLSDAGSTYAPAADFGYGTSTMLYAAPGSTITFNADVSFGLMGADAGSAKAGEAVTIDAYDGAYVYAPDGSQYVIFLTVNNSGGQYNEASMTDDIFTVATAVTAAAEEPAEEPAEEVEEPAEEAAEEAVEEAEEPAPVEEFPVVEEPVTEPEPEVVAEPAPVEEPAAPAATYTKPAELGAMLPFDDSTAFGGPASTTGGLWSRRTANQYDPALDNIKIPGAAFVYGATGFEIPAALAGYTKGDVNALKAGEWGVYSYTNADYGMELAYVIVMPAEGVAINTGDAGVMVFAAVFALAAVAMVAVLPRKKTEK